MDTRKVCRGLWMFIFNAIEESDSNQPTELIQEKVRDVAVVVFRGALKENILGAMLASFHAWPEPWKSLAYNILAGRIYGDKKGSALHSAYVDMVTHLCAPGGEYDDFTTAFTRTQFMPSWILVAEVERAHREEDFWHACALEEELDDRKMDDRKRVEDELRQLQMASTWLAEALAADLRLGACVTP